MQLKVVNTGHSPGLNIAVSAQSLPALPVDQLQIPSGREIIAGCRKTGRAHTADTELPNGAVFPGVENEQTYPLPLDLIPLNRFTSLPATSPNFAAILIACFKYSYFGGNGTTALPLIVTINTNFAALHEGEKIPNDKIKVLDQMGIYAD